jgi:DNA mismatch repair ATPase MutS
MIQVMAQIGSFIPCDENSLNMIKQILTRLNVDCNENFNKNKSSFEQEMRTMIIHL